MNYEVTYLLVYIIEIYIIFIFLIVKLLLNNCLVPMYHSTFLKVF